MSDRKTGVLKVPGATLHYEVHGSGPVLLLLPGGGGDAAVFDDMAAGLARHHTVVTVDPRGYSRSPLDGPAAQQRVEVQSDDAYRLLGLLSPPGDPAYVFGSSSGAIVATELLIRHPEAVTLVVAHEPPLMGLLPDAERYRAFFARVVDVYHRQGPGEAMACFMSRIGMDDAGPLSTHQGELPPRTAELMGRLAANVPDFLEYEVRQFTSHLPDLTALEKLSSQLALAVGRKSRANDRPAYRPAAFLAQRLDTGLDYFPGGHTGYSAHPAESAEILLGILRRPASGTPSEP